MKARGGTNRILFFFVFRFFLGSIALQRCSAGWTHGDFERRALYHSAESKKTPISTQFPPELSRTLVECTPSPFQISWCVVRIHRLQQRRKSNSEHVVKLRLIPPTNLNPHAAHTSKWDSLCCSPRRSVCQTRVPLSSSTTVSAVIQPLASISTK